jgi:AraC-like DNA-binding protein
MLIDLYETIKTHPGYFKQLHCRELLFTQYDCPQEDIRQDLFSACNYIAYVVSGKRIFYTPGAIHVMTEGKCVFAKQGGWIADKEPGEGWCVMVFFIPDDYLKEFVKGNRQHLPIRALEKAPASQMIDLHITELTKSFFASMIPYFTQAVTPPEYLLELKFKELLMNILIDPANRLLLSWLCELGECDKPPLSSVMEANYMYKLQLKDFAKIAQRSIAVFNREFLNVYKVTPGKWLIQKRLDHAAMILETSSIPVNEVAFNSGFESTTHFNRVFKEKFGLSPTKHRQTGIVGDRN